MRCALFCWSFGWNTTRGFCGISVAAVTLSGFRRWSSCLLVGVSPRPGVCHPFGVKRDSSPDFVDHETKTPLSPERAEESSGEQRPRNEMNPGFSENPERVGNTLHYATNLYPAPCIVSMSRGWAGSSSSFCRNLTMKLSTVRVLTESSYPQTLVSSWSRVTV
jgi:hypothetical protein